MQFQAVLETNGRTATGIEVPAHVVEALGSGKRPKVAVTLRDYTYRTTVAVMGGRYLIPVAAEVRANAGISAGDVLDVTMVLDDAPRVVEVPDDLAKALAKAKVRPAFDTLAYSHQKEHVRSVTDAKRQETRERRIEQVVAALRQPK